MSELELRRSLGPGLKIVILGGSGFEELTKQVAAALQSFQSAIFLTGGQPGVQETFAKSCDATKVYNLCSGPCSFNGQSIQAGKTAKEAQSLLASLGDVYITIQGGQEVAEQATLAFARGAAVIPVVATGGASSGMFGFPAAALKKPSFLSKEQWSCLSTPSDPQATAAAIAVAVAGYSRGKCGAGTLATRREQERMERLAASMISREAPWLSPAFQKLGPVIEVGGHVISVVGPPVYWFYAGLYKGYQALPKDAACCLWGVGQCFFGGTYAAFFAAAEAFKTSGGNQMLVSIQDLKEDAVAVLDANSTKEKELGHKTTPWEKMKLMLRTVDPEHVSLAMRSVWGGCMGIVMALKYEFARTVALAHSIGDHLRPLAGKVLAPSALAVTPPEYRQWIEPSINLTCKVVATVVAWKLQSILSSVQSGVAGGMLASRSAWSYVMPLLKEKGLTGLELQDSMVDEVLGWGLAATGIYFQVWKGGTPPLILLPVTLPMGLAESWLRWSVTWLG